MRLIFFNLFDAYDNIKKIFRKVDIQKLLYSVFVFCRYDTKFYSSLLKCSQNLFCLRKEECVVCHMYVGFCNILLAECVQYLGIYLPGKNRERLFKSLSYSASDFFISRREVFVLVEYSTETLHNSRR